MTDLYLGSGCGVFEAPHGGGFTDRYWSDLQPFPVLRQLLYETKQTWQEKRGEIRWLNCSLTIRPSLKRTLSNPAKVAKGGGDTRKGWKNRALKPPLRERERGRGPCYWGPDGAKGAESSLQSCTVLFCTIKWHGGQGRDNGLLSPRSRPAAPEESHPFSPYVCGRLTGCSSHRGRMLSIWTHEVCPQWPTGSSQSLPGNLARTCRDSGQHSGD